VTDTGAGDLFSRPRAASAVDPCLLSANGASVVAEDLHGALGRKLAQVGFHPSGQGLTEATPFFWAGHIARAIREPSERYRHVHLRPKASRALGLCLVRRAGAPGRSREWSTTATSTALANFGLRIQPARSRWMSTAFLFLSPNVPGLQFAMRAMVYLGDTLDHAIAGHGDPLAIVTNTYAGRAPGEDATTSFFASSLAARAFWSNASPSATSGQQVEVSAASCSRPAALSKQWFGASWRSVRLPQRGSLARNHAVGGG
jgi:hypothetical protein